MHFIFPKKSKQDAYRKVLVLLVQRVPWTWEHVRAKRLQDVPILLREMPQSLQDATQPEEAEMDEGEQEVPRKRNGDGRNVRVRKAPKYPSKV